VSDARRDETRRLAGQIAAHLRHLREFRGAAYVSAAPSPRRHHIGIGIGAGPEGQVETERGETWPSEQVQAAPPAGEPPRFTDQAGGPGERSAARAPGPSAPTWPSDQVRPTAAPGARPGARSPGPAAPTWPSDQVRSAAAPTAGPGGAPRPAAPARGNEPTWPESQVETAPGSRPRSRLPIADTALPGLADARPTGSADAGLRSQAQAWTPAEKLAYLRAKNLGQCTRCKLSRTRKNIVFGVGDAEAKLMFIGEAPGADEDRQGEPFVGAAGRRLTQWIERLGMTREQVYIANVLKCRPPGNRDPDADEIEKCSPFLRAQIRAIRPAVIVALGRYAGMLLIGAPQEQTLKSMRSRSWTYEDASAALRIPLYVTYHPSYVIRREGELPPGQRNPADDTVMSDLQQALRVVQGRR
jgi:uracil-DNA glycosylase family 4